MTTNRKTRRLIFFSRAVMGLDLLWIALCVWGGLDLTDAAYVRITVAWLILGVSSPAALLFLPSLPELAGEKKRLSEMKDTLLAWGILALIGGLCIGYDAWALAEGKEPMWVSVRLGAAMATFFAFYGHLLAQRCAVPCVCWNDVGVSARAMSGEVYHFSWNEIVMGYIYRSAGKVHTFSVDGRSFILPGGRAEAEAFARYSQERKQALNARG